MSLKTSNILMVTFGMLFFLVFKSSSVTAGSLSYTISTLYNLSNMQGIQLTGAYNTSSGQGVSNESWSMEFKNNLILIPMGDLLVPVQMASPSLTLKHADRGRFVFSEGKVRSATRTQVVKYEHKAGVVNNYRPTLFVTIDGLNLGNDLQGPGCGLNNWQCDFDERLKSELNYYQYKHFAVNWDSKLSIRTQVEDLSGVIEDFLSAKIDAWDVVIVGYSRGGIFAHDLTKYLKDNQKINSMHTFLLDPTASVWHSDIYPGYKQNSSLFTNYGSLFYDGQAFIDSVNMTLGTVGDQNISGYNNYGRNDYLFNSSHADFAKNWVASVDRGLAVALNDVRSRKDYGSFTPDGDSGLEVITIKAEKGLVLDGDVDINSGNVEIWANLSLGGVSVGDIEAAVGQDGIDIAGSTALASSRFIINQDQISLSQNTVLSSYSASISSDGLSANVDLVFSGASVSIDGGEISININIFGHDVGGSSDVRDAVLSGGLSFL